MENIIIKQLDADLTCDEYILRDKQVVFKVSSSRQRVKCPYCGTCSDKIHSVYQREIQDVPLQNKQTILLLNVRKMFCNNGECTRTTFSERFDFVAPNGKKTNRLTEKILITSSKLSSVAAANLLKTDSIKTSKSSICELLKKNAHSCG